MAERKKSTAPSARSIGEKARMADNLRAVAHLDKLVKFGQRLQASAVKLQKEQTQTQARFLDKLKANVKRQRPLPTRKAKK